MLLTISVVIFGGIFIGVTILEFQSGWGFSLPDWKFYYMGIVAITVIIIVYLLKSPGQTRD